MCKLLAEIFSFGFMIIVVFDNVFLDVNFKGLY